MATFKFGRAIDIHWNGYDIQGPADTVFSIPDQLYEEFDADISPVEPTLQWIDTNEFQTLSSSVSVTTLQSTFPIALATTTSGKIISISSSTNPAGYTMVADGTGGVIFQAGSTGALTSVVGVSPISSIVSGNTASVSIDQALLSVADASTATTLRTYVKNSSGSTITKGSVVYVTGADGTNALIDLATASTEAGSSKVLGIAASTMTNNAFGYVIENGQLSNIDTSAATAGSSVWLGNTLGSYVFNSPPAEPSNSVYLGVVTKANASTGEVLVKVQNGYELDELHDVYVGGVSTALPLVYNSTSSGWIAQALTSVGIADNAIVGSKIIDGAVTSGKIADGSVTSAKIAAGAVGSAALGTGAVVSASIATGAVNSSILADNAVVAAKINAGSVGTAKIDSGAATSGQVLTANGSGGASFSTTSVSGTIVTETLTGTGTWTVPSGVKYFDLVVIGGGGGGGSGGLILSSAATTIANGGNSGSTPGSLFIPYYPVGSSTSFSYSVATGGAGGASVSATKAAGVTYAQILTTGNSGSAASGATTFGSRISVGAGAGGVGGGAYAAATGTAQSANAATASTTAFLSYNAITATVGSGQIGQTDGGTANNAVNATLTQYPSLTISNTAVFPLVPTIGLLGDQSVAAQSGSVTISGPGTFVTAVGVGASYDTTTPGVFGRGAGGASAIAKNAAAAGNGETGEAQSGCSGGAVAVRISSGATTATSITATAGSGTSAVGYGASGAGGSGTAFSYASTTLATDSSYTASSGAGGNGSNGVIVIRYIK
jgi:hypothetical protein